MIQQAYTVSACYLGSSDQQLLVNFENCFVFPHRLFLIICISLVLSQCGTIDYGSYVNLTERNLQDAQKFILMHEVVQPVVPVPYFMEDNVRFSHVAVDVVQGKDMLYHIIYLATGIVPHHVCMERKRRSISSINIYVHVIYSKISTTLDIPY